jgi:hypothetical protein
MRPVLSVVASILLASCANPWTQEMGVQSLINRDLAMELPRYTSVEAFAPTSDYEGRVTLVNEAQGSPRRMERTVTSAPAKTRATTAILEDSATSMVERLFGEYELDLLHIRKGPISNYATFQQRYKGREVVGAKLIVRLDQAAEWLTSSTTLVHPSLLSQLALDRELSLDSAAFYPAAHRVRKSREVIYTRTTQDQKLEAFAATEFNIYDPASYQEILMWVDEASEELVGFHHLTGNAATIQMKGSIVPNQPGDVVTFAAFPQLVAKMPSGATVLSDDQGLFPLESLQSGDGSELANVYLENEHIVVTNNERAKRAAIFDPLRLTEETFLIDEGPSLEERNVFYWVMQAKKMLKEKFNFTRSVGQLTAITQFGENFDNAFFMPGANMLAFGAGYQLLKNTALSRDIVIHEFGHSMIQEIYGTTPGYEFSAMNEAMSDYLAAIVTNNPQIAEGAMHERTGMKYLRTVENSYVYPKNMSGKGFHVDGQIFSGALWTLRGMLGAEIADKLVHEAQLAQAKTVHEFYREMLAVDEDQSDRNPWTPSKHEAQIRKAFALHGIGSADVVFEQAPLKDYTIPWQKGCWAL